MLTANYCACCGKRFYRECTAEEWPFKAYIDRTETHGTAMYMCSWECLEGVRAERIEFAKRWKTVRRLAYRLLREEFEFGWDVTNLYDFVMEYPRILTKGGKYDRGYFEELKAAKLQGDSRKGTRLFGRPIKG